MTPPFVKRYLIALDKYKWIGLTSFAMVLGASGVVALQPPPPITYIADGSLAYSGPKVSFSKTGSQIQEEGQEINEDVLMSNAVISTVAAKVNVKPKELGSHINVKFPKKGKNGATDTTLITINYQDSEEKRAGETLALLMQQMVQQSFTVNTARLRDIIKSINQRLPEVKRELTEAEQRLGRYDRIEGPAISAAENSSLLGAITSGEQQQQQLQLTLSGLDTQIVSLQQKLGLTPNQAYISSALSADPIIQSLRAQIYQNETQITLLSKDLRPEHPTMIQLRRQQQTYNQLLQQRAAEVFSGNGTAAPLTGSQAIRSQSSLDPARQQLANKLVELQTQRDTLQQQLNQVRSLAPQLRQRYITIPDKQLERTRLEQQMQLKRTLYDTIQAKLVDAKAAEAETVSSLSIAKPPQVTSVVPPAKSVPITIGVGMLVGVLVGGGAIFLLGSLESTFKTMEDIRESLRQREVTVLGILPSLIVFDLPRDGVPVATELDSPYLEFYERYRSNLRRVGDKNLKVVLITSTVGQEGKTLTAFNLGIASARAGRRTLILEGDLRSPSQAHSLKVAPDADAALEPLRYYGNLSQCIHLVPEVENLYIVPSPGPVRHPAAIIESSEMRRLFEDVRGRFDLVILDTPHMSSCNDALLLEPNTDGIILVTRPGYTQENLLVETIDQLNEADLQLLGAIINDVDIPVILPEPPEELEVSTTLQKPETSEKPVEQEVSAGVSR